jgi:hypothetical protein
MTPDQNTGWMVKVRTLLGRGYGVEDIAIKLECSVADVRREVEIYRHEGRIREIVRGRK